MNWFNALARYKQAAITALLIRNARRRGENPTFSSTSTPPEISDHAPD